MYNFLTARQFMHIFPYSVAFALVYEKVWNFITPRGILITVQLWDISEKLLLCRMSGWTRHWIYLIQFLYPYLLKERCDTNSLFFTLFLPIFLVVLDRLNVVSFNISFRLWKSNRVYAIRVYIYDNLLFGRDFKMSCVFQELFSSIADVFMEFMLVSTCEDTLCELTFVFL